MVTEWSQRVPADKLYANAVTLFNDKMAGIELHEAASSNTAGQNGFIRANAVTDLMSGVVAPSRTSRMKKIRKMEKGTPP